ncbi:hypothetical protein OPT61_g8885 [Boeremia exigua]|uniref:Uncharacterized protein n=1 Tax=Boeremia exigua TaxID=749465 RepID=A0ACC2HXI7_9PLEO|nr:hypothetical protein OPT61_g8885 [Boeremia exigua]
MRVRHDWLPALPGVQLYVPAPRVSVEESLSQLSVEDAAGTGVQSQESQISSSILPSCEMVSDVEIKAEYTDEQSRDFTSPETLVGSDYDEVFADAVSTVSTPAKSSDILSQLLVAAESEPPQHDTTNSVQFTLPQSPTPTDDFVMVGYESDRTDFQETTPSPSVRKAQRKRVSATGKTSHHFRTKPQASTGKLPVRRLNFAAEIKRQSANTGKKSSNAQALEDLRTLEREPSHTWDQDERELLCVLNRWYRCTDRTTEMTVFSQIFNSITGLELRSRVVRDQFERHLRLYGAEAFREYGRVFSIPFNDPNHQYADIRTLVESEARTLGLELLKREVDANIPAGTAKYAKSPRTRDIYRSLVRKASQIAEWEAGYELISKTNPSTSRSVPAISGAFNMQIENDWEVIEDIETSPKLVRVIEFPRPTSARPHLVFRVWDAHNRTKFVDGSFVAQTFVDWPKPHPMPFALNDPSEAGKIFVASHLSKEGNMPTFISTCSSLLQVLSYATQMENPQIALINLDAPCLKQENRVHHARDVLSWLKSQRLALWAHYKGHGEYMIWADIEREAILHTLDLVDLTEVLNKDDDCRRLMSFEAFDAGKKTNAIASTIREKNITLDIKTAQALGKIARTFGLSKSDVTLPHLEDFIARMMDGWSIEKAEMDRHNLSSLAATFAVSLGSHAGGYHLQEVMGAFVNGVDHGTECAAHWSRSRTGSRRQRFRHT